MKIATTVECNPTSIDHIGCGEEADVFSFIDKYGSKKTIKIYSQSISVNKGFANVKKDLIEKTNLLRSASKVLKPLLNSEIELNRNKYYFQVFDYIDTDLLSICNNKNGNINLYEFFIIALRIVMGVYSLHKANIVHCDIKLENILVNLKDKKVKLIDFGFTKRIERDCSYIPQGTPVYASPELKSVLGKIPGYMLFPSDIYSLGIILYAIFTKSINLPLFHYYKINQKLAPLPY